MVMLIVDILLMLILFWLAQYWLVTFIVCIELSTSPLKSTILLFLAKPPLNL